MRPRRAGRRRVVAVLVAAGLADRGLAKVLSITNTSAVSHQRAMNREPANSRNNCVPLCRRRVFRRDWAKVAK